MLPLLTLPHARDLPSPLYHFSNQRKTPQKARFLFILLAGALLVLSSCHKENVVCEKTYPYKGKGTIDLSNGPAGTGEGTVIGHFTSFAQDDTTVFPVIKGTTTTTTDIGDQIYGTHTGLAKELGHSMLQVDTNNTIVGGTGRYAGATGSFKEHAIVDEATGKGSFTYDDTIMLIEHCNCYN